MNLNFSPNNLLSSPSIFVYFTISFTLVSTQPSPQLDYINFIKGTFGKNLTTYATERGLLHLDANFTTFCSRYKKEYFSNDEIEYRKGNFLYSLDMIQTSNLDYDNGRIPYRLAINRFADVVS